MTFLRSRKVSNGSGLRGMRRLRAQDAPIPQASTGTSAFPLRHGPGGRATHAKDGCRPDPAGARPWHLAD